MKEITEYVIRTCSDCAYTYGLGEIVSPEGAVLFKAGFYGLSKTELNAKLKSLGKVVLR